MLALLLQAPSLFAGPWVAASWGPSSIKLVPGATVDATLSIWGEFDKAGYSVKIYAGNATGTDTSQLVHPRIDTALPYTASLRTESMPLPANVKGNVLRLNRIDNGDVRVRFEIPKNQDFEISSTSPHEVVMTFRLYSFEPINKAAGTYSDQITAIVTVH